MVCEWEAGQLWEGLRGVEEVWHCPLISCLSVQVLKVLNSRSTVRELSMEDLYHNALLCSSCFASLFNCCNNLYIQNVIMQWERQQAMSPSLFTQLLYICILYICAYLPYNILLECTCIIIHVELEGGAHII